ncbi:hypothetical protein [Streptomyces tubbatahanensis]|nr:hypothetical protein [Streptomyces tubbatahanensis]
MAQRKREVEGWFYDGMVKALDEKEDGEEAIRFIPPSRGGGQLPR